MRRVAVAGALLALAACATRAAPGPPDTRPVEAAPAMRTVSVELDIFSGMPNPVWTLSAEQAEAFHGLLAGLPEAAPEAGPGNLGYRGFIVSLEEGAGSRAIRIRHGLVVDSQAGRPVYAADPGRRIERWLLESAGSALDPQVRALVERDLEKKD